MESGLQDNQLRRSSCGAQEAALLTAPRAHEVLDAVLRGRDKMLQGEAVKKVTCDER